MSPPCFQYLCQFLFMFCCPFEDDEFDAHIPSSSLSSSSSVSALSASSWFGPLSSPPYAHGQRPCRSFILSQADITTAVSITTSSRFGLIIATTPPPPEILFTVLLATPSAPPPPSITAASGPASSPCPSPSPAPSPSPPLPPQHPIVVSQEVLEFIGPTQQFVQYVQYVQMLQKTSPNSSAVRSTIPPLTPAEQEAVSNLIKQGLAIEQQVSLSSNLIIVVFLSIHSFSLTLPSLLDAGLSLSNSLHLLTRFRTCLRLSGLQCPLRPFQLCPPSPPLLWYPCTLHLLLHSQPWLA